MNATAACFKIDGEWLTDFARTRVIEGRFDHGYRTLSEGLDGISADQVLAILRGDKKLVGVNDLDFIDDDDQDWKAKLNWHYAGCFVDRYGRFMRPYAVVTSSGPNDMAHADKITKGSDSIGRKTNTFGLVRGEYAGSSLFYADDPANDILRLVKCNPETMIDSGTTRDGKRHVLFKQVHNFPFQLVDAAKLEDAQGALDAFLADGRSLMEVGYCNTFPPEIFKVNYPVNDPTEPRPQGNLTHVSIDNPEAAADAKLLGRARFDKINADKNKCTVEEWQEYMNRINNPASPIAQRTDAFFKAIKEQPKLLDSIPEWRKKIAEQAGDDYIMIEVEGKKPLRVPRAPFEQWCLHKGDAAHLAAPWVPVSVSGVKMFGDDPFHTDFMLGAGLDIDAMHGPIGSAIWDARFKFQEEKAHQKAAVLCGTGRTDWLRVVHPKRGEECASDEVAVIPNAGPHYVSAAMTAGAIITERGGEMAHLVTISREKDLKIVRVENARKLYPIGIKARVDCSRGDVNVRNDYKMNIGGVEIDIDDC